MPERIEFQGEDLVIPSDITGLLTDIHSTFIQRYASEQNLPGNDRNLGLLKQATQLSATSALNISGMTMCYLSTPPEPIQTGFDSKNNLRLECLHAHQHCWNLSGIKQSC